MWYQLGQTAEKAMEPPVVLREKMIEVALSFAEIPHDRPLTTPVQGRFAILVTGARYVFDLAVFPSGADPRLVMLAHGDDDPAAPRPWDEFRLPLPARG